MYGYILFWVIAAIVGFIGWGLLIYWKIRVANADAEAVFDAQKKFDPRLESMGLENYRRAYLRAHGPRPAIFTAAASLTAFISMPLCFSISEWAFNVMWNESGREAVMDYGLAPWLFFVTLLMIVCWIGVGAVFARLYYVNRPQSLDKELDKELSLT